MKQSYDITRKELKTLLLTGCGLFDDECLKQYYLELQKSKPKKEKFIRINSICCLAEGFLNFRLQTASQLTFFHIYSSSGNINELWLFLEDICKGEQFSFFMPEQEDSFALLLAKVIDKDNIRLTLFNQKWYKIIWNENKGNSELHCNRYKDFKQHINFDVIINKRDFVYTFYVALHEIFYKFRNIPRKDKIYPRKVKKGIYQRNSDIVRKYLGYIPATDYDLLLLQSLKTYNLENIESILKQGANPNAIIRAGKDDEQPLIDEFLQRASYFDGNRRVYSVIKLLVQYGAKTLSMYCAVFGNLNLLVIKYLVKHNCVFDDHTIADVATDAWVLKEDGESFYKWHEKLDNWYSEQLFNVSPNYETTKELFVPECGYYEESEE